MEPKIDPTDVSLAHNNQIQLAVLLAAHYSAARASVDDWLKRRDQYLMLFVTGAAATFGVYMSKPDAPLLLYLVAPLTLVVMCAYVSADLHIAFLCKWLTVEYTSLLNKYATTYKVISLAPWHWDNSAALQEFYERGIGRIRYMFVASAFGLANAAAPILARTVAGQVDATLLVASASAVVLSSASLALVYGKRKKMAAFHARCDGAEQ